MSQSPKPPQSPGRLPYRLRVSRRRRSVGLTVTDTGELVVHVPQGLTQEAIHRVIAKNRAWIGNKQAERQQALNRLETGKAYYQGKAYGVKINPQGTISLHLSEGILLINSKESQPDIWSRLFDWYWREATTFLEERVHHVAARMELAPPRLEVRNWRRRWGECRSDGRLRFNWRLVLLPPKIVDYVVVHELAHLVVPGHSAKFWREVEKYFPDCAERRRWLKVYGSPFLFWKFAGQEKNADEEAFKPAEAGNSRKNPG